jgi:hypothetical protein
MDSWRLIPVVTRFLKMQIVIERKILGNKRGCRESDNLFVFANGSSAQANTTIKNSRKTILKNYTATNCRQSATS